MPSPNAAVPPPHASDYALHMIIPLQITLDCNTQQLECLYPGMMVLFIVTSAARGLREAVASVVEQYPGLTTMWSLFASADTLSIAS